MPDDSVAESDDMVADDESASRDFDTDMQTIHDYVSALTELRTTSVLGMTSAIDNLETTLRGTAASSTRPDVMSAVTKSLVKYLEKQAVSAVKDETGADLSGVVDLIHNLYDAIEKAEKATAALKVEDWVRNARTRISNLLLKDTNGAELRKLIEAEYNANESGGRLWYIGGVENDLAALRQIKMPDAELMQIKLYESWINEHFDGDGVDGQGKINVQFDSDRTLLSVSLDAPAGEQVARALNTLIEAEDDFTLMKLDVVKKLSIDDSSVCLEGDNAIRKAALDDEADAFLSSPDTWDLIRAFTPQA